jgi:hypothetical protein
MTQLIFPALYYAADDAANSAQAALLFHHKISAVLLISGAIFNLINPMTLSVAILTALLFLSSLAAYAYGRFQDYQGRWYQSRALAESVKTVTWRLIMSAEPFGKEGRDVNLEKFRKLLSELLDENKGIGEHISGDWSQHDQVTAEMKAALLLPFAEKKQFYLENRIDDQRGWYARKSGENRRASRTYFLLLCGIYVVAVVLLFIRVANPEMAYLPIDPLAVAAGSVIGWVQVKRYNELSSAYGLTAHEVGIIKSRFDSVKTNEYLAMFVRDAENAFSREHTQWAARRDQ